MNWEEWTEWETQSKKEGAVMEFEKCKQYGLELVWDYKVHRFYLEAGVVEKALSSAEAIIAGKDEKIKDLEEKLRILKYFTPPPGWVDKFEPTRISGSEIILRQKNYELEHRLLQLADKLQRSSDAKTKAAVRCAFEAEQLRKLVQS